MHKGTVELISVGDELLMGKITNTNATWLAGRITSLGGRVSRCTVVGDDIPDVSAAVKESLGRGVEWVIMTGGLGPTFDDLTLEAVARATDRPLRLDAQALAELKKRYEKLQSQGGGYIELNAARMKMVTLPEGSIPLPNPVGSAPGVFIPLGDQKLYCLPGVPAEMESIFDAFIAPRMKDVLGATARFEAMLRVQGAGEGILASSLAELKKSNPRMYIKSHPKGHIDGRPSIEIHLAASGKELQTVRMNVEAVVKALDEIIRGYGGEVVRIDG